MKALQLLALPALCLCATLASVSCTSIKPKTSSTTTTVPGVPGGQYIETAKITATVTGIDRAKRKITFVTPEAKSFVVEAGQEVTGFEQIQIGDQLKVTLTNTLEVRMAKPGEKIEDVYDYTADLAPDGAKPGLVLEDSSRIMATVSAIDLKRRKATLTFPDGKSSKFDVRKDIDLSQRAVGEKVVIRTTEVYAAKIEKP